ncbi:hypothetical protein RAA17_13170 [Komagataeibacter rhaeticus]|nr:hypothetical protein [Komagataeibacter rhaeticus]
MEDCEAMLEAQRRGGGRLMVAYRLHCEPGTLELISRCRNGDFGHLMAFTSIFGQNFSEANHRGHSGYWSGPVPDMGTYPLNAVRNLFAREPAEVHAVGSRTPGRGFNFDDTVSVTLRFAEGQMAQFLVSYACAPVENFTLTGNRGVSWPRHATCLVPMSALPIPPPSTGARKPAVMTRWSSSGRDRLFFRLHPSRP